MIPLPMVVTKCKYLTGVWTGMCSKHCCICNGRYIGCESYTPTYMDGKPAPPVGDNIQTPRIKKGVK